MRHILQTRHLPRSQLDAKRGPEYVEDSSRVYGRFPALLSQRLLFHDRKLRRPLRARIQRCEKRSLIPLTKANPLARVLPLPKRKEHPRRNRHPTRKRPHRQRLVRPSNPIPSLLQLLRLPRKHLRLRSVQRLRQSRMVQQPLRHGQLRRPDERMLRHGPGRYLRQRGQFLREQGREFV